MSEADHSRQSASSGALLWEGLERAENVHIPFTFSLILSLDAVNYVPRAANDSFSMRI